MLLDRPIHKALFSSHVRLEAKRNALDALSCFGTDRISAQAAAQDPLHKKGGYNTNNDTNRNEPGNGTFGTARKQW
jgi:hypothetical protein